MSARIARLLPRKALLALGLLAAGHGTVVLVQARLTARAVADLDATALPWLAVAFAARAVLSWTTETVARRSAATVKEHLRGRLVAAAGTQESGGRFATLLGSGLDALDASLTGYVPQMARAALVPLLVLIQLAFADPASALVVLVTLPLIPVFGILIGLRTKDATAHQWAHLNRLGGHFGDVLTGLPTLRAFRRTGHQSGVIRAMAHAHRTATMRALRTAFLSGLVLDLVASLSVAVVAVPVGLRLLAGHLDLETGLLVLILTPEAYGPLRALGTRFHAGAEGMAVARQIEETLDPAHLPASASGRTSGLAPAPGVTPASGRTPGPVPTHGSTPVTLTGDIRLCDVTVTYPGRRHPALDRVSLTIRPGERVAVVGPSGAGKSTLLHLLMGFVTPDGGRVLVDGADLSTLDPTAWRARTAWLGQHPHLFATTIADNIRLGAPDATDDEVTAAARAAHADTFVSALPEGYATELGERGAGLSAGQRQRIALARAHLRDAPLVLLDEPTARLDVSSEQAVVEAATTLLHGRTAVMVAHRPALLASATRVLRIVDGQVSELPLPPAPSDHPLHPPRSEQPSGLRLHPARTEGTPA
ncbi:thiol reductant ABC exporter subunit CydD [Streptomyces sp. NPDC001941]|uniref:thiol reductant ABC exporter subunit CydD n=1 Tax=Streptomyces sp. NPDC001941 TaxID=3154659 RepID=UPI0033307FF0